MSQESKLRILVAIVSYGATNDQYLCQLLREYNSMSFDVDIVVLSNIQKDLGPGVEVVVPQPLKNPWTLPFAHKKIFAERLKSYDLFIYTEDDVLLTERNIHAFLTISKVLTENEILGFLRFERGTDGTVSYPEAHGHFHWDPESVESIENYKFARFTNEHSACYVISQKQLRRAIESGGFLEERHDGKYDLICSAATDPYLHCGLNRLICISHLDDFLICHLSAKYSGRDLRVDGPEMQRQVEALLRIDQNGNRPTVLFHTETKLRGGLFSKAYYEPPNPEIISVVPPGAQKVLSLGCGWGALEAHLVANGMKVTAVPLDSVIPGGAEAGAVEIVEGDFKTARQRLAGRQFDCLLVSNVLHLVEDAATVLSSFAELLSHGSVAIISVPNLLRIKLTYDLAKKVASYGHEALPVTCMKMYSDASFRRLGDFATTGVRVTSHKTLCEWSSAAGLKLERTIDVLPPRAKRASRLTLGMFDSIFASEIIAIAKRP